MFPDGCADAVRRGAGRRDLRGAIAIMGARLQLDGDDLVSKEHALLFAENNMVRVVDMGSTNGTFIGGARVPRGDAGAKNAMQLANYDVLKVGGHTLSVTY